MFWSILWSAYLVNSGAPCRYGWVICGNWRCAYMDEWSKMTNSTNECSAADERGMTSQSYNLQRDRFLYCVFNRAMHKWPPSIGIALVIQIVDAFWVIDCFLRSDGTNFQGFQPCLVQPLLCMLVVYVSVVCGADCLLSTPHGPVKNVAMRAYSGSAHYIISLSEGEILYMFPF